MGSEIMINFFGDILADVSPFMLIATLVVIVIAAMVHGTIGLGFPLIATPILAVIFDVRSAIVLTLLPTAAVNIVTLYKSGGIVASLKRWWVLVLSGGVGAALSSLVLASHDPEPFRLVLAGTIVIYLVANTFFGDRLGWIQQVPVAAMVVFGLLAGVANGLANVMVAVLLIFVLEMRLERLHTVALLNTCFVVGKLTQISVLAGTGFVTIGVLATTAPLAVVAVAMVLVGIRYRDRVPVELWRKVLQLLLAILAVVLVVQFFF